MQALHSEASQPGNRAAMLRMLRSGATLLGQKGSNILLDRLPELEVPTPGDMGPADHGPLRSER